jgi:hypothetical protein
MRSVLVTLALLLAVGTAGCTRPDDPEVATAGSGPGAAAGSRAAPGGEEDSPLRYSQCMRDQGLPWFPDPQPDGGMKVSVPDGTNPAKMDKAEKACQKYQPGADENGPPLSAADLDKLRQVAQCIRDRGFPKWPDPDSHGRTTIDSKTLGADPNDPAFVKAQQECHKYAPPRPKRSGS